MFLRNITAQVQRTNQTLGEYLITLSLNLPLLVLCIVSCCCAFAKILPPILQGELFVIDETNSIFLLPCGDLCDVPVTPTVTDNDDKDFTTGLTDDDLTTTYEYIGCYGDQSDRVLSGLFLPKYQEMTTEVCQSIS